MSTTINGTTGINKIQDNTVTSAKIQDGTVVDADISASAAIAQSKTAALASGDMPSGSIIQVVNNVSTVPNHTSLSTYSDYTICSITFTPKKAGSHFILMGDWSYNIMCDNNFQCAETTFFSGASELARYFVNYSGYGTGSGDPNNSNIYQPTSLQYYWSNASYTLGNSLTVHSKLTPSRGSGSVGHPTIEVKNNPSNEASQLTILEIG